MFVASKGQAVDFNGSKLIRLDKFPVENKEIILCHIEKTNSQSGALQGFCIDVTGYAEMDGEILKKGKGVRLHFWEGTAPKHIRLKLFTKTGFVWVYNICEIDSTYLTNDDQGNSREGHSKTIDYGHNGAAMIVEEIENGRRYRCSDVSGADKEDQFGDIVFTVQREPTGVTD